MPFYADMDIRTNSTRPSDLAESTKDMRFLSVIEIADLLGAMPAALTFAPSDADELRADTMRDRQVEALRAEGI